MHSTARSLTRIDPGEGGRSDRMFLNRDLDMNNTTNTDIEDVASDESARDISQQGTRRNSAADDSAVDVQSTDTADDSREEESEMAVAGGGEERPKPKIAVRLEENYTLARKNMFSVINATEHELDLGVQEDNNATRSISSNCFGSVRANLTGGGLGGGFTDSEGICQKAFTRAGFPAHLSR